MIMYTRNSEKTTMNLWINYVLKACLILNYACIIPVGCQCVLPFSNGTWLSSSRGTWTIPENRTEIQNFEGTFVPSQTTQDLTCISSSGSQYILGTSSGIELFPGVIVTSYTCIEIQTTSFSPSKYEFYFVTDTDIATGEPFTSNISVVCAGSASVTGSNTNIVIADGTDAGTVKETLPNVIRGEYSVTVTDHNSVTGNTTVLNSCNDVSAFYVTEVENATQTVTAVGFSDSGVLYNMKSFTTSGITYIYAYNNDTSVNSVSTYRFTCWAVAQDSGSSTIYATVYPEVCQDGQNATHIPSGGQVLVLTPSADNTSGGAGLSAAVIAVIVLVCIVVVIGIVIVVIYFIRKKKGLSKQSSKNTKDDTDGAAGKKGIKRPKSSNDLDSARLIDEKNKQKLAKKMAKKKETRTIAVQASIWTAPIKRTTTALKASINRSSSQNSIKFIPYIDKPVNKTNNSVNTSKSVIRANTTLEPKKTDMTHQSITRSKTTVERKVPKNIPKYLVGKNKVISSKQKLIKQISKIDAHSSAHYANEFEKLYSFPNEGNPNDFHNTLDIPDETINENTEGKNKPNEIKRNDVKVEENKDKAQLESKQKALSREYTRKSLKSRPSTSDEVLRVKLNRSGSVRKTNSEQMERCRTILKFSYNSPYAMSEAQKAYIAGKANWINDQVRKDRESKKHIGDMRKLESQRAFDAWIKNKRMSIKSVRRNYSKNYGKTSTISKPSVDNISSPQ